jgi:AcrR family transcriptional regulator
LGERFEHVLKNGPDVDNARNDGDIEVGLSATRARIAQAALETLRAKGFAGATGREIARTGGFNQALVLYHFGSIRNALLAALDLVGNRRMRAYQPLFENARTGSELAPLEPWIGMAEHKLRALLIGSGFRVVGPSLRPGVRGHRLVSGD